MGCAKVSEGCKHCYAKRLTTDRMGLDVWGKNKPRKITSSTWRNPISWNRAAEAEGVRRRVFCASLCDVFEDHPQLIEPRARLWNLIRECRGLDWQLLTKRPENIPAMLPKDWGQDGWPHVWLGSSIEDMRVAHRVTNLLKTPAVVRFISYEPALGPLNDLDISQLDWVIYGGESGPGFRPHDIQWARDMRAKCEAAGVTYFYKQSSAPRTEMGIRLDGEIVRNYPVARTALAVAPGQPGLF